MNIFANYIPTFLFVLLRASLFVSLVPLFSNQSFPRIFKIGFAIAIAVILTPVVHIDTKGIPISYLVFREIILGIAMGSMVRILFLSIEMAGQFMSNSLGLSIATVFNPEFGQTTEIARFYTLMATMILFSTEAHHELIYIFVRSYETVPLGAIDLRALISIILDQGSRLFILAIKIAAPIMVGMVMTSLLLGFIYKAAPQLNIFFISFPVYIFVGFLIMIISLPAFINTLNNGFSDVKDQLIKIIPIRGL
jgi:flagellar biosynthetic protein FliR